MEEQDDGLNFFPELFVGPNLFILPHATTYNYNKPIMLYGVFFS